MRYTSGGLSSWPNGGGCCYEPGQIEALLALDINGTVIVICPTCTPSHRRRLALSSPPCSNRSASTGSERSVELDFRAGLAHLVTPVVARLVVKG